MPLLDYEPRDFGSYLGAPFTQRSTISFTWDELSKAAVTVGRRNWEDVLRFGTYSVVEMLWRLAIIRANLYEDSLGYLQPTDAFVALDRSEKGGISYFLGMVFAKLCADKLFNVPWLLHLDVYETMLNPTLALNRRPDMVGLDPARQWIVVESKARSWSMPDYTMERGKLQTRSLRNIGGQLLAMRVAIGTCFSRFGLTARIWDPEGADSGAEDVPIDDDRFLRAYYRPIVELSRFQQPKPHVSGSSDIPRISAELAGLDAQIIVDDDILQWYDSELPFWSVVKRAQRLRRRTLLSEVKRGQNLSPAQREKLLPEAVREVEGERQAALDTGPEDGVEVSLGPSWSSEYMKRQPRDRAG